MENTNFVSLSKQTVFDNINVDNIKGSVAAWYCVNNSKVMNSNNLVPK